jgi:hypothetical protein
LGGIYALERISRESEEDYWPIMEILAAYVRHNAPRSSAEEFDEEEWRVDHAQPDIQAILHIIGRRPRAWPTQESKRIDLEGTNLRFAAFFGANVTGVWFWNADLRRAQFQQANLRGAYFENADLREAFFMRARNFARSNFTNANLEGASFEGADLKGADLEGAIGLTQDQIDQALGDEDTRLPAGLQVPDSWRSERADETDGY